MQILPIISSAKKNYIYISELNCWNLFCFYWLLFLLTCLLLSGGSPGSDDRLAAFFFLVKIIKHWSFRNVLNWLMKTIFFMVLAWSLSFPNNTMQSNIQDNCWLLESTKLYKHTSLNYVMVFLTGGPAFIKETQTQCYISRPNSFLLSHSHT